MKNLLLQKFDQVLELVAVKGARSLNELSAELDIPLPTLSRLISDMVEMNLLEKIDYYRVAPAPGLIRLGECAKNHSRLYQIAVPKIRQFAEKTQTNAVFAGIEDEVVFKFFDCSLPKNHTVSMWENGLMPVMLVASGVKSPRCLELFKDAYPAASAMEMMILEQDLEYAAREKKIFRTNTMRQWSCALSFFSCRMHLGICFYGNVADKYSRERFDMECSMLVSHIASNLKEE